MVCPPDGIRGRAARSMMKVVLLGARTKLVCTFREGLSDRKSTMSLTPRFRDSGNHLLDCLPADEFNPLRPMLQKVNLSLRQVVHQFETDVTHVHFPTSALMSLLTVMEEDDPIEMSTVGHEGFIGLAASLGVLESP